MLPGSAFASTEYSWSFTVLEEVGRAPVEGYQVEVILEDERNARRSTLKCSTDVHGRCLLRGLVSGGNIFRKAMGSGTWTLAREGFDPNYKVEFKNTSGTATFTSVLVNVLPDPLNFSVKDAEGLPLPGVDIRYEEGIDRERTTVCTTDANGSCNFIPPRRMRGRYFASKAGHYLATIDGKGASALVLHRRISPAQLEEANARAVIECNKRETCDRVYSTAQLYMAQTTDMKVAFSNDTLTETHNALEPTQTAGRITRAPAGKKGWEVAIQLYCGKPKERASTSLLAVEIEDLTEFRCNRARLAAYENFRSWVEPRAN